jgi:uncharacterized membrane protein
VSDLVAVAYEDRATAERVRDELFQLADEQATRQDPGARLPRPIAAIELEDAVVISRSADGKVQLHQAKSAAASGAARGPFGAG